MQHLEKVIEVQGIVGFENSDGAPVTFERDIRLTAEGNKGYIKLPSDVMLDRDTIDYLSKQLEIFQRQIDAGKES